MTIEQVPIVTSYSLLDPTTLESVDFEMIGLVAILVFDTVDEMDNYALVATVRGGDVGSVGITIFGDDTFDCFENHAPYSVAGDNHILKAMDLGRGAGENQVSSLSVSNTVYSGHRRTGEILSSCGTLILSTIADFCSDCPPALPPSFVCPNELFESLCPHLCGLCNE